jgi:hypothetical protein
MKKMKLNLDRLQVETFETAAATTERGTVHGHYSQRGTCDGRAATCQDGRSCTARCGTALGCTIAI